MRIFDVKIIVDQYNKNNGRHFGSYPNEEFHIFAEGFDEAFKYMKENFDSYWYKYSRWSETVSENTELKFYITSISFSDIENLILESIDKNKIGIFMETKNKNNGAIGIEVGEN